MKEIKKEIFTQKAPAPIGIYSQAIQHDHTVYLSGQIPLNPKTGELISQDFAEQVEQVFANIAEIAKAAGGSLDNIIKLTIYLIDLNHFSLVNEAMSKHFTKPYPARTTIEIKGLPKQSLVEIDAIMKL